MAKEDEMQVDITALAAIEINTLTCTLGDLISGQTHPISSTPRPLFLTVLYTVRLTER
jgi:hypothetical protein